MQKAIHIRTVGTKRQLKAFAKFPWRVYKDDPLWVPPLISDQIANLDPLRGSFHRHAEIALFTAHRGEELLGTIAAFVDQRAIEYLDHAVGGFGFFEVIEDYSVAERLLETACDWLRDQNIPEMRGPTNFTDSERPGVLVDGRDCPPVMLEAHTPPYYQDFLENFGMERDHDLFAYRAYRHQIGEELKNLPPELSRVADIARTVANATIRKVNMDNWSEEISTAHHLFNTTLRHLPAHVPMSLSDFQRFADQLRPFIDPDLALFAEVQGKPVGFCVALPDINQVLIHLNGRLFPFGWLRVKRLISQIDAVTFKLMGVLEEYRRRGIDALLYLEAVKSIYEKGYRWMDGSVTSEQNIMVNLIANRLGAERYKHFRVYRLTL